MTKLFFDAKIVASSSNKQTLCKVVASWAMKSKYIESIWLAPTDPLRKIKQ